MSANRNESVLRIEGLRAGIAGKEILRGVDLVVKSGEVHAIMGPNGAGKSTLARVLLGHPSYQVLGGTVSLDGVDLLSLPTWERAQAGLFFAPQDPIELPGVTLMDIIDRRIAVRELSYGAKKRDLSDLVLHEANAVGVGSALLERGLNVDCSGGEKKRIETLQLAVLDARIAVLDEIDSGLDIDALRDVAQTIERLTHESTERDGEIKPPLGVLAVTHYRRLLEVLKPDVVHVLVDGRIVRSGDAQLSEELERSGYNEYEEARASSPSTATS